jgi:hypothetical protein
MTTLTDIQNKALSFLDNPPSDPFIVFELIYANDRYFVSTFLFDRFVENWIIRTRSIEFFSERFKVMELLIEATPEAIDLYRAYGNEIFEHYIGERAPNTGRNQNLLVNILKAYFLKVTDIFEEIDRLAS